jgi:two-component system sensor histidine kinase UhpB
LSKHLKILHLEDSDADAEIVSRLLKKTGLNFESRLVMNKKDFLDALNNFHPDVIISDNSLPQFNATEALEIVNERLNNVPFILVTGTVSEEFAANIIKLGADDYILKDRLARLPAAIETALQKKKAVALLRRREEEINFKSNLLATVGQAVIATDLDGNVIYWNSAAEKIYGWMSAEAIGKNIINLTPSKEMKEQSAKILHELKKGHSWSGEFMVERKDGTTFPVFVTDSPIYDNEGRMTGVIGVSNDITEQKKAQQALKEMELKILKQKIEEQKKISRAIIRAQEQERNHIGKELHDNINQILAGTKLYLSVAAKTNESVKNLVKYPLELIDTSIEEIRALSSKQVVNLKNINLERMIDELVNSLNKTTDIKTRFIYEVAKPITDDELKLNIYRIIQELVNNIIKHSHASVVNIIISGKATSVTIEVTDNGQGFNVNKIRKGIGISNMMDRTESFNGRMDIETSEGNGCKICINLPLLNALHN